MTITENTFPLGYFYIVSNLNEFVVDIRNSTATDARPKIVMASKKPLSPERNTQLWIHQDGFLTNKATGLVLDINRAESFMAIFTKENRLYLDKMKEEDAAADQRFGYEPETGFIYVLCDSNIVADILDSDVNEDARVIVYKRKSLDGNEANPANQQWAIEMADPPHKIDEEDEEEDDSKRARMKAWFGNWTGWGHKQQDVLEVSQLKEANKKVYQDKKPKASYELIAAAVAYEAVSLWEKKQEEEGEEIHHPTAKKIVAGIVAAELAKLLQERVTDDDAEDSDQKKDLITKMTMSAATNYLGQKHGIF